MKKIWLMILCLALLMPVGVQAQQTPSAVAEEEDHWEIGLLKQLELLDVADPNAAVTKQSMVSGLNRVFRNTATSIDVYFEGQDLSGTLLYSQAVMVLLDVMGYAPYVEMLGYPTNEAKGYLAAAKRIDLISNANVSDEQTISVDEYAKLFYRALTEISLMRPQSYGRDEVKYGIDKGVTMLSEYMQLEKIQGVVNGIDHISNDTRDGKNLNQIKIGSTWYRHSFDYDLFAYYGYYVEAYVQKNQEEVCALVIAEHKNRVVEISSEDIQTGSASKTKIVYQQDNKNRTAMLDAEADVIFNRELLRDYKASDFQRKNSNYTLIDNNGDGIYDVVIIEQFGSFVVEKVSAEEQKIIDLEGQVYDLEEYFKDGYKIFQADGTETQLGKAAKYNVISYLCADSGKWTYMVISSQKVSGVLSESREDMRYIKIDGVEYECSALYLENRKNHDTVNVGDRITAFMDINGFVIDLRYVSSVVRAGYFMGGVEEGFGGLRFKVLDQDGAIKELTASGSILFNGTRTSAEEVLQNPLLMKNGAFIKQLILYRPDGRGEIVRMDTAVNENTTGGTGFDGFTLNYDSAKNGSLRALTLNGTRIIGSKYVATGDALLFGISTEEDECYVQAGNGIPTNSGLNVKLYNVNDNYEPQYIVYEFSRKTGSWVDYYVDPIMVDNISQVINQDGEVVYQLNGYTIAGKNKSAYIKDGTIKTQNYNILSGDSRYLSVELKDVPRGSIIVALEDTKGIYAFALQHMPQMDNSEVIFEKITSATGNEYGINEHMFNGQYLFSYGEILKRTSTGVVINNHLPTEEEQAAGGVFPMQAWNRHLPLDPADTVLLYDKEADKIYVETASSLLPGDKLFTKRNGTTYKGLFAYR